MISSNNKGIWLCQIQDRQRKPFAWIMELLTSMVGSWALVVLLLQISGVRDLEGAWVMALAATAVCVLHLLLQMRLRKGQLGKQDDAGCLRIQPVNGMRRAAKMLLYPGFQRIAATRHGGRGMTL